MTARPPCLPQPPQAALGSARPGSRVMGAGLRPSFPAERPRGASIYGRRVRANQTKNILKKVPKTKILQWTVGLLSFIALSELIS